MNGPVFFALVEVLCRAFRSGRSFLLCRHILSTPRPATNASFRLFVLHLPKPLSDTSTHHNTDTMADIKRDESNVNDSTTTSSNNPQTYASFTFPGSQPPATGPPSIAGLDFSTLPPGARVDIWSIQIPPAAHPIAAVATHPESTRLNARTGSRQAENSFPRNPDHGNPSRGRGRGRGRGRSGHRGRGRADTPALTRDGATPTSSLPAVDPDYGALKLFTGERTARSHTQS